MATQSKTTFAGQLDFSGTTNPGLKVNSLTTTQRDALAAANGMIIYNSTTSTIQKYENSGWIDVNKVNGVQALTAATTSAASERIPAGTAPTSPVEGDIWNDSTQKSEMAYFDGIKQARPGVIFTQTADQTITNTITETTILGSGVGTKTLPANFFVAGKTIRLRVGGIYSTPVTGATATIKVKYGSTILASKATTSLLSGASGLEFDGEVAITCRTTGASGTVSIHGDIEYGTGLTGTLAVDPLNNAGSTVTIDTTASSALDVTITWDTADSGKSAKSTVCIIETLN